MEIKRIAIDTSKHFFTVHGLDAQERTVLRRELRRGQIEPFFAKLEPTEIALESQRRQYGLVERARQLGWDDVQVVDDDLGKSGGGTTRPGFEKLLAAICEGRVRGSCVA